MSLRSRFRTGLAAGVAGAAMLVTPGVAGAATTEYHPEADARSFDKGASGWQGGSTSSGACVELLLCPAITNSHQAGGGDEGAGDGFIRTSVVSVAGVGGTSTGTWSSPAFRYRGVDGKQADSVRLTLTRRSDVGEFVGVAGNDATFSVDLVAASGDAASISVLPDRTLAGADDWVQLRRVEIPSAQLKLGERYRVRISSRYSTGATVAPSGSADYDDVVLRARRDTGSGGGDGSGNGGNGSGGNGSGTNGNGGNGGDGSGGGNGGAGADGNATAGSGVAGAAVLKGDRLQVRVRCARKVDGKCKIKLKGLLKKKGPALGPASKTKVKAGKRKKVTLKVKPKHLPKLANAKRVFVKQKVKADGAKSKKVVRLKLRRS